MPHQRSVTRRRLLGGSAAILGAAAIDSLLPAWAQHAHGMAAGAGELSGNDISLTIGRIPLSPDGRAGHAVAINGTVPGPLIRLREGQAVRISVTNTLDEETSIHWHGLLVPFQMDGVPGVSFPGIPPGATFVYEFPVRQSGTYWYHSHSGLQEQEGHYGPIVIEPVKELAPADREHVVVLSDFSTLHPHTIFARLKQEAGFFNLQRQTVAGLLSGRDKTFRERLSWAEMRMDPTDISDVTGSTYTFLINGRGPADNWTGLFTPGQRVKLRFINAGAQTIFNVRIPGLRMSVVAADGQYVRPVAVDEFQIGNAETYDVIVEPAGDRAYSIIAEAVDRSGMGRATLAPREGMAAEVPPLRERPLATMKDMGMDMSSMGGDSSHAMPSGGDAHAGHAMPMAGAVPGMAPPPRRGADAHDMGGMEMDMLNPSNAPQVTMGPGVQMITPMATDRTGEPGQGLESVGHRVLVYKDLIALEPNPDSRAPGRSMEIRLTGNMERFMWGFDGKKFSDGPLPYSFRDGERVRVTLVNDTMMTHPIHLHGHFFELVHGPVGRLPRKHTVNVLPSGQVTFDFTPEHGDWAFHCHMLYHMHAGMFQVFTVRRTGAGT